MTQPRSHSGAPNAAQVLAAVCAVMEVAAVDMPGKTTPRTKPRLQWARNMAAFVMHDLGIPDGAIARSCGGIHRITIIVRRRRMAEKLETTQRYRDHHKVILARLASLHRSVVPRTRTRDAASASCRQAAASAEAQVQAQDRHIPDPARTLVEPLSPSPIPAA